MRGLHTNEDPVQPKTLGEVNTKFVKGIEYMKEEVETLKKRE